MSKAPDPRPGDAPGPVEFIDRKDHLGHSAREYNAIRSSFGTELVTFIDRHSRENTDVVLMRFGDVKGYAATIEVVTSAVETVLTQLVAEGYVHVADKGFASKEERKERIDAWLLKIQHTMAPYNETAPTVARGQYI